MTVQDVGSNPVVSTLHCNEMPLFCWDRVNRDPRERIQGRSEGIMGVWRLGRTAT